MLRKRSRSKKKMTDNDPPDESNVHTSKKDSELKTGGSSGQENFREDGTHKSHEKRRDQKKDRTGSKFTRGKDQKNTRGSGSNFQNGRHKVGETGRAEWSRGKLDRRKRNDEEQSAKRRKIDESGKEVDAVKPSSQEETESEQRRPKRKVAVMIGYAGTGYKGMQINVEEKTIEGDIFQAFVAAGAISKANADDPKKSSLVRCARTDKGVHAAGNVISLKLIIEDPDVVRKINDNLPSQIRVWGYVRTNGGFSCYQSCDSRWYEYLIPTYSFIPPHPQSFLGEKLIETATKEGCVENYLNLQQDALSFWEDAMNNHVKPVLDKLDQETRAAALAAVHKEEDDIMVDTKIERDRNKEVDIPKEQPVASENHAGPPAPLITDTTSKEKSEISSENDKILDHSRPEIEINGSVTESSIVETSRLVKSDEISNSTNHLEIAIREVKAAYITAKKLYRISSKRQARVQEALDCYIGTHNFHNYTIQKKFSDPSAKRLIKSFQVAAEPIIINGTEWLSMKVHGQSFMMHQIRKMVGMAALAVRCGTPVQRIKESYGPERISIPKAPGLGLLLERPVFSSYNTRAVTELSRPIIDFDKYKNDMDDFKQREIYNRIFREEERDHQFHSFFHHIDNYRSDNFLWVTAGGIPMAKMGPAKGEMSKRLRELSGDEIDDNQVEG